MTRFGIFVPQGWRMDLVGIGSPVEQWEAMTAVARRADEQDWDSIWLYDHFHTIPTPSEHTTFEVWTTTAALARDTSRVNIGQMVGCNGYRNPALYAKMASTVDVASGGRLYAGIGAGWYEHEWRAYGYPWPETPQRMGQFREAVQIITKMWTEDEPVFHGKYYSIDKPINSPRSHDGVTPPPLWIGGGGPNVTLKLVAKYATAANFGFGDPDTLREKIALLKKHCEDIGRDFDEIIVSTTFPMVQVDGDEKADDVIEQVRGGIDVETFKNMYKIGSSNELADKVGALIDAGANYLIFYVPGVAKDLTRVDRAQELAKQFA